LEKRIKIPSFRLAGEKDDNPLASGDVRVSKITAMQQGAGGELN
jgi:hypothetical protein